MNLRTVQGLRSTNAQPEVYRAQARFGLVTFVFWSVDIYVVVARSMLTRIDRKALVALMK